ncbi:MAG TPA: hypothetical protein VEQ10_22350 [Vicinamibacteria bacterium]|nr:hypothetical protein [Vicinamibacteria bacterium]
MGTPGYSWVCGACGRRVPLRVDVCHCGASRAQAAAATAPLPPPAAPDAAVDGWRSLPLDVQALVLAALVSFVLGIAWLAYDPPRAKPMPALLGYADVPAQPATSWAHPRPPFRMPWWR